MRKRGRENYKVPKWYLVEIDFEGYRKLDEFENRRELEETAAEYGVQIIWTEKTRFCDIGIERLAYVEGNRSDVERFLQ